MRNNFFKLRQEETKLLYFVTNKNLRQFGRTDKTITIVFLNRTRKSKKTLRQPVLFFINLQTAQLAEKTDVYNS